MSLCTAKAEPPSLNGPDSTLKPRAFPHVGVFIPGETRSSSHFRPQGKNGFTMKMR
jgi:hypothetical protein